MAITQAFVEAELNAPCGAFKVLHYAWSQPLNDVLEANDNHVLDLCLTPRPKLARGRFRECWAAERFERIGDIFFVPSGLSMNGRCESGVQASMLCHLRADALREWFDGELDWTERRLEASLDIASPTIRALLMRLAEEVRTPGFASLTLTELITAQLAIELSRYFRQVPEGAPPTGLAPWQLRRIDERLADGAEPPHLQELADLCRISVRHLTRAFKASRGVSVGDHLTEIRVDRAKRLLAGRRTIKEIAFALGFASPSAFAFAFRSATGQSPSQFRMTSHPHHMRRPVRDRMASALQ